MLRQFEYKKLGAASEDRMNELGREGWELVAVQGVAFFKREIIPASALVPERRAS